MHLRKQNCEILKNFVIKFSYQIRFDLDIEQVICKIK